MHRFWTVQLVCAALCAGLSNAARAGGADPVQAASTNATNTTKLADLSVEQLLGVSIDKVYGASRYEQKVTQAPASVSIVTADEIKEFGHRTLADVLRSVRGLYASNDRNYSYLGMRGFLRPGDYNTRELVLVDGHRMNDNVYDQASFGYENMLDVDLIDRVEVIRGPSSSIYGDNAFFGVINIVTKHGAQINGVEASGEAGSFDTYKGRFSYGKLFDNQVELALSGSFYTSEGQEHLYYPEFDQRISTNSLAAHNGIAQNMDREQAGSFFGSLRYNEFTLSGFFDWRVKRVPTAAYGTIFNDPRFETTDYRAYLDLKWEHSISEDVHLLGRAFYDTAPYRATYPYNYAAPGDPPDIEINKDKTDSQWVGTEWQLTAKLFDRHTLIAGLEYRENLQQDQVNYDDVIPRFYYADDHRTSRNVGLFAQAEVAILTNLTFNAGVRYDYYSDSFGGTANPRVGLIYSPWANGTFKALYGQAFRAPNDFERFYSPLQQTLPELQPETIRTYELVYEQYFAGHYRSSISGYYYTIDDLITQSEVAPGDLPFVNLGRVDAKGVEFEVEAKYDPGWLIRASYALQRAEDRDTGVELTDSPRHLAKLNLAAPLYRDKVFAGLELQDNGSVRTQAGRRADDFVLVNLTLFSKELVKGVELSGSIYNLFDTRYGYPGAAEHIQDIINQDGRSFRVKLTYRF